MNISQHSLVPFTTQLSNSGNYLSRFYQHYPLSGSYLRPFPQSGDTYRYIMEPAGAIELSSNGLVPFSPWICYDFTNPKVPVLLLY